MNDSSVTYQRNFLRSRVAEALLLAALWGGCLDPAGAQPTFEGVVKTSFDVANHVEHERTLPESIVVDGTQLAPSAWFQFGILTLLNLSGLDTHQAPRGTWIMPEDPYPVVILSEAAYGESLNRQEYLAFLQGLASSLPDGTRLPSSFLLKGSDYRFVDAFHLVAGLLRFYAAYGYLPPFIAPKVATSRGLFAWDIPEQKQTWLSAFQNESGYSYGNNNEYYWTAVLDFEMYQLAQSIVAQESDPYVAGRRLFDWSFDRFSRSPYGNNFDVTNLTGFVSNSWDMIGNMHGTSGKPSLINRGLYTAAGLVHGYDRRGYGGALFTESEGWYNAEIHAPYGAPLSENPFFSFSGDPVAQHRNSLQISPDATIFAEVSRLIRLDTSPPELRAFWVNPTDVEQRGGHAIVQTAVEGGFNAVVLTVKSFVGRLYFDTERDDNLGEDALGPLLAAASTHPEIQIFAAFNTLGDYELLRADSWGQRYTSDSHGQPYNDFFMSPCIPGYVDYLKRIVGDLYRKYPVDGLILARNYVHSDAWANPECGMDDRATTRFKEDRIAAFANELAEHAKSISANRKVLYMTAPLLDTSGTGLETYSDDATPERLSKTDFDGIILTIQGLAWLTADNEGYPLPSQAARDRYVDIYLDAVGSDLPVYTMIHLSKEWMYPSAFYRGLARSYRSDGLSGVFFTAVNTPEGEFGPAFVSEQYAKLRYIRFHDPPPNKAVITTTTTESEMNARRRLVVEPPYPNPSDGSVRLAFEQPSRGLVTIRVYDVLGRMMETLHDRVFPPGRYEAIWEAGAMTGVYIIQLESASGSTAHTVVVL